MLLAVNMPEQEPHVGQAAFSRASKASADSLSFCRAAAPMKTFDQVDRFAVGRLAGLHGAAADEDRGNVAAHGPHEHAGHDLVAIGDADHAVEGVGLEHRLHGVGDHLAAGQRVLHARVPHGNAVVDADGVEDEGHAAGLADAFLDVLAHLVQVDVAGNDVGITVANGDERFAEVVVAHAGGAEQAAVGARESPSLMMSERMVQNKRVWCRINGNSLL